MAAYKVNWENVGEIKEVHEIGYMDPFHHGYPRWGGEFREMLWVAPSWGDCIVCTRGLSSIDDAFEFYINSDEVIEELNRSWQMSLILEVGRIIPNVPKFKERLLENKYLTLQLDLDGAPPEWGSDHEGGNIGLFIGLKNDNIDESSLNFRAINMKLMRPNELNYAIEKGGDGRHELAGLYLKQGNACVTSLARESVI